MGLTRDQYQAIVDRTNQSSVEVAMQTERTIADVFEELADRQPDKTFLIFEGKHFSYGEVNERAAMYANAAIHHGVGVRDTVALMMENRVEFFYAWLGILKAGAYAALINTQAKAKAVSHAVTTVDCQLAIVGAECYGRYASGDERLDAIPLLVVDDLLTDLPAAQYSDKTNAKNIEQALSESAHRRFDPGCRAGLKNSDNACYIFTSGTTGLPKAAIITHSKWLSTGHRWLAMTDIDERDVFYCVIPIFHGAGLMSLFSTVFAVGGPCVLRRKFSAKSFWKDVSEYKITVAIYVGEICRYLLNMPVSSEEKNHSLRVLLGSGMGMDIWNPFVERFGDHISIREGWGSTESNCNMTNLDNRPGSCGRIPYWEKTFMRMAAYDVENDTHLRDASGLCQLADEGVVGELLGQVHNGNGDIVSPFDGYTDAEATNKKLLRDVFEKGDCWFSSGDLFRYDDEGYFYFVDRIGDTFRWKSENVSTTEVAHQLVDYTAAEIINVYGVKVPNTEGRAGMAAVVMKSGQPFDPLSFYQIATANLQSYATPLFVRVMKEMDVTGTFKLRKVDLQRDGYNPDRFEDELYLLDRDKQCYSPYSTDVLARLGLAAFE